MRNPEDAEEAVQEALTRAWRARDSCASPDAPLPWLLQITRREALRVLDRRRRLHERETADECAVLAVAGDNGVDRLLGTLRTEQALACLQPDERALVHLRYVLDLSHPQVAARLRLPEGTVKVRLHRIRARLRAVLEEEG